MRFAIKVVWADGEEEYLVRGLCSNGPIALFPNREEAERQREFLAQGFDQGETQGVFVVPAPAQGAVRGEG